MNKDQKKKLETILAKLVRLQNELVDSSKLKNSLVVEHLEAAKNSLVLANSL